MKRPIWVVLLAGCVSTSDPVQVGPGVYSVSATGDGMRTAAATKEIAYEKGRKHCAEQGGQFTLVNSDVYNTRMGIDTTVDVTFRCD